MSIYRSPGVYVKEIDASLYVKSSASSVAGFVGVATKGPVGQATLVTNWAQFEETFGGFRADSWLAYAVKSFFDNGGGIAYIVRTVHYTDVADASTAVSEFASGAINDSLSAAAISIKATSHGTWANGLKVVGTVSVVGDLSIVVFDADDNQLERFTGLTFGAANVGDENYVESKINGRSRYITVEDNGLTPVTTTDTLAGGIDGLVGLVDADYIGSATGRTGLYALSEVDTMRLVAVPGIETPAVHAALITFVENHKYAFAVMGTPQGLTPSAAIEYRFGTGAYSHSSFNSSYAAMYWPWVRFYDQRTRRDDGYQPPEGVVLGKIAHNDAVANFWDAPAGLNRGLVRNVLGVEYNTSPGERDELYDAGVNVINNFRSDGVVLWGQKTLQVKSSAFDRINVRRLLIQVEYDLARASRNFLFEPNDKRTWEQFKRTANPYFQRIKDNGGVYDFLVVCDETTNTPTNIDQNIMVARIFLKPTKTAEFFELPFIVTPTGANFADFQR